MCLRTLSANSLLGMCGWDAKLAHVLHAGIMQRIWWKVECMTCSTLHLKLWYHTMGLDMTSHEVACALTSNQLWL